MQGNPSHATLTLDRRWAPVDGRLGALAVGRGPSSVLRYPDGIELEVVVVEPTTQENAGRTIETAERLAGPGRVVLVAGEVPLDWRAALRAAGVSFVDVHGAAEIRWPRLSVSTHRFEGVGQRRRTPVPLQKTRAILAQELLARGPALSSSLSDMATATGLSLATVSRAVAQLAGQGLVERRRKGHSVLVSVAAPDALLLRLAERTPFPLDEAITAYRWGRTGGDVAHDLTRSTSAASVSVAVTGRVAAEAYGVRATSSAREVRVWIDPDVELEQVLDALGAEAAPVDEANLLVVPDRRGIGLHRSSSVDSPWGPVRVAHPVRVWCDLQDEPRGPELADQMWRSHHG